MEHTVRRQRMCAVRRENWNGGHTSQTSQTLFKHKDNETLGRHKQKKGQPDTHVHKQKYLCADK